MAFTAVVCGLQTTDSAPSSASDQDSLKVADRTKDGAFLMAQAEQLEEAVRRYRAEHLDEASYSEFASTLRNQLLSTIALLADGTEETRSAGVRTSQTEEDIKSVSAQTSQTHEVTDAEASGHRTSRLTRHCDSSCHLEIIYAAPPDIVVTDRRILKTRVGRYLIRRGVLGRTCAVMASCSLTCYLLAFAVFSEELHWNDRTVVLPNIVLYVLSGVSLSLLLFFGSHSVRIEAAKQCLSLRAIIWAYSFGLASMAYFLPLLNNLVGVSTFQLVVCGVLTILHWWCVSFVIITLDSTVLSLINKILIMSCVDIACAFQLVAVVMRSDALNLELCWSKTCIYSSLLLRFSLLQTLISTSAAIYSLRKHGCAFLVGVYSFKVRIPSAIFPQGIECLS
eukprot:TRINITY_DN5587_c0_g1_i2.p1 TRINITY_DN5587_c0_g1~~TRINITY_DN5587_c0_g1_i2.p1  ORF type:complete len:394 (-),score=37.37 TRINITY_DN5587_c0_g1_i2:355-1536(-)